jgi:cytochrome c oxidase subunit 2
MDTDFKLFPDSASSVAERVDALYLFEVGVALFFTFLICALILFFGIRYRRGSKASRANPPENKLLEASWAVVPLIISMVMFFWGAVLYQDMQSPPDDALPIEVVGKQWMWKVQHPDGRTEINALHVPRGRAVRLKMISEDVIHSFFVPAFRMKQDVLPGYFTQMWFEPTEVGTYHLFCAEYCGTEHSLMRGKVVVMEPTDYAKWAAEQVGEPPAVSGARLFERHRCGDCHRPEGAGPVLAGVYGNRVPLEQGGAIIADEQYLRDAILDPQKHVVAGRQSVMPSFQGQLDEWQVMQLIAYIKTLSDEPAAANE